MSKHVLLVRDAKRVAKHNKTLGLLNKPVSQEAQAQARQASLLVTLRAKRSNEYRQLFKKQADLRFGVKK